MAGPSDEVTASSSTPAPGATTKTTQEPKTEKPAKPSGKELKERAKAEKAARRAREKAESAPSNGPTTPQGANGQPGAVKGGKGEVAGGQKQRQGEASQKNAQDGKTQHKQVASQSASVQSLAMRGKQTQGAPVKEVRKASKEVGLFGHLYSQPKRYTLEGVSKEVHPAVLALGFQMSSYVICGSNARCVAMLLAFKKAIQSYTTPHNTSLARHLTNHYLSPQIDYLKSHRPISVSMGNAIRWLKDYIIHIDPDTPEKEAKEDICASIDSFIRERVTAADTLIATTACAKIRDGSTVLTFAKSSVAEKVLLQAHHQGKKFKAIVVDSRPLFEGKNLVRSLAAAGIQTSYMLHTAVSHALKDADLVLLGAHAMMSNGRLYSRVGTAAVAMIAHSRDIPVIVCCESIKFTDRVALDSIVLNEIAPPDELILPSTLAPSRAPPPPSEQAAKDKTEKSDGGDSNGVGTLLKWRDAQNLQLLNILYDVTPAEYINMVITEYGSLPPSSVPVVHRMSTDKDVRT